MQSGAFFDMQVTLKFKDSTKHKNILLAHAYNPQIHNNTPLPPEIMYRFYNKEKPEVNCLILWIMFPSYLFLISFIIHSFYQNRSSWIIGVGLSLSCENH